MIKCIIFDLDGVIVSTDKLHYKAWKKLADKEGIYFDESINHLLRGVSREESLNIILKNTNRTFTSDEKYALLEYKNKEYVKLLNTLGEKDVLPGVIQLLSLLKKRNIKIAIGSSSKNAKTILQKIGLLQIFDCISDGTNIKKSKPNPEVFIYAAEQLKLSYRDCAVVEDAVSGLEAAKACNMKTFAVGEAVNSPLADYSFNEILDVIKKGE